MVDEPFNRDAEDDQPGTYGEGSRAGRPPGGPDEEPLFLLLNLQGLNNLLESLKEDTDQQDAEGPTLVVVPITTDSNEVLQAVRRLRGNPPASAPPTGSGRAEPRYCSADSPTMPAAQQHETPQLAPEHGRYSENVLSTRQKEVLECLIQGYSNKQIARRLGLEEGTVRGHVRTVLQKMGAKNRTQAACFAIERRYAARADGETTAARRNPCGLF